MDEQRMLLNPPSSTQEAETDSPSALNLIPGRTIVERPFINRERSIGAPGNPGRNDDPGHERHTG